MFTFYSSTRPRGLIQTHLVYNFPPSSDTIKTLYSDRQQWEELKMTSFIANPLVHKAESPQASLFPKLSLLPPQGQG